MTPNALHFPKPYPDELLYSIIARSGRHLGIASPKFLLEQLFDSRHIVATADLPGRLERLRWCLEERWGWPLSEAVMALTVLPFYTANRTVAARQRAIQALIWDRASDLHTRLGICASTVLTPSLLRFCPTCCEADFAQRGETYWRRVHQLPGVVVCPEHGTPLACSDIPLRPRERHEFVPLAPEHVQKPNRQDTVEARYHSALLSVAHAAQTWLAMTTDDPCRAKMADLITALQDKGYGPDKQGLARLEKTIIARYGHEYLAQCDSTFAATGRLKWLAELARTPRRVLHPLRQIWIEDVLAASETVSNSTSPFGDGPWPCRNWLAPHHGQPVVTEIEPFRDHRHPERTLARFRCDCGFVYSAQMGAPPRAKPHVIEFGALFPAEAQAMFARGYTRRAIATALEVDWKTVDRWVHGESNQGANNPDYGKDQLNWLNLVEANPDLGVKAIRAQAPALYARLYRNRRDWLKANSPRQAEPTRVVSRQVDWKTRDRELEQRVTAMAEQIRGEDPPRRITKTQIAARLDCRALIQQKIGKLPETKAVLEEMTETPVAFRLRRLEWAYARYGPDISDQMLLYRAKIREAYVGEAVRAKIAQLRRGKLKHCA